MVSICKTSDPTDLAGMGSTGFRCKKYNIKSGNYEYGFTVARNCCSNRVGGDYVMTLVSGHLWGKITACTGTKYDTAFMSRESSSDELSNVTAIEGNAIYTGGVGAVQVAKGNTVFREGSSTGFSKGRVVNTGVTISESGSYYENCLLIEFEDSAAHGDSGGIVYTSTNNGYMIVGTIVAGYSSSDYKTLVVMPVANILSGLRTSSYYVTIY